MIELTCKNCNKIFNVFPNRLKRKSPARFCSISCAVSWRNKTFMNPSYFRDINGKKNPMFGNKRFGKKNANWKGGCKCEIKRKDGYILIREKIGKNVIREKLKHRQIIENILERPLFKNEIIHHKDKNPLNNLPNNLIIMTQGEHAKLHLQKQLN